MSPAGAERAVLLLAERLRARPRVTVLTGAGVSAASGVPTFRGEGGLWGAYRAEDLATARAFARDPALVWEWYEWRRQKVAACRPNPAHVTLAAWSRRLADMTVVTQNVDGLHERAGTVELLRFHGSLWHFSCWEGCPQSPPAWPEDRVPLPEIPPRCPHCRGLARPAVVWFGEGIDPSIYRRAAAAASRAEVFLTVGTSAVVHPAAGLVEIARDAGAYTAEINPEATPATSGVDLVIAAPAEEALPAVEAELAGR